MKRCLLLAVLLLLPLVAHADPFERVPTQSYVTQEVMSAGGQNVPNCNVLVDMNHLGGDPSLYAYIQVGDGFSEAFVGPVLHNGALDFGAGIGAEQSDTYRLRWNVYTSYAANGYSGWASFKRSSAGWWLRTYGDYQLRPRFHVGLFYQRDAGYGPRVQFDLPTPFSLSLWSSLCRTNDNSTVMVSGLQATF